MAGPQQIGADVLTAAQQIADGFFLVGGHVNRCQRTRVIEHGEVTRIASIGLDTVTGPPRNEGRGDDVARDALGGERALQLEATRAGLKQHRTAPFLRATRLTKRTIVGLSDVSECSAGVR